MFIKINNDLYLRKDDIIAIERVTEGEHEDDPIKGEGRGEKTPDEVNITMDGDITYEDTECDWAEVTRQLLS